MNIIQILDSIELGSYALPEFQRGYVWTGNDVRKLMNSLYRDFPIGSLLIWETPMNPDIIRGEAAAATSVKLILDGQQRMTSLYGIVKGKPPVFFDGDDKAFMNLYFNLEEESFEFYSQQKMKGNRAWVSVTEIMSGVGAFLMKHHGNMDDANYYLSNIDKLTRIESIKNRDIPLQTVIGEDKTIDVVVEIFNNVNSGGTKLSKGDLALAKICAEWPGMRQEMKAILNRFGQRGFYFKQEWLLRCLLVHLTKHAYFSFFDGVSTKDIKDGLKTVEEYIGTILEHIGSRLGLDHDRVLGGPYAIVLMVAYLSMRKGKLSGAAEWDKLLFWYVHSFLWGRYAGSTESVLAQDLNVLTSGGGIEELVGLLKQSRADLMLRSEDFWGWSKGSRFYPLLYMLSRVGRARDWGTGVELSNSLLGHNSSLQVHHIFPKAVLYGAGKTRSEVNALANYAFLTQETNLEISNDKPEDYFPRYMKKCPGAIESHCVPTDPALLTIEAYPAFLESRRQMLATRANAILDELWNGTLSYSGVSLSNISVADDEEDTELNELAEWMEEMGLHPGIRGYGAVSGYGGKPIIIDVAWPEGVQPGRTEPVALMIDEEDSDVYTVQAAGFRVFRSTQEMQLFVTTKYLDGE